MRPSMLALCLASLTSSLPAQTTSPSQATRVARALDPRVLRAHLEFLADDALEGRAPGTRGGKTAAKYIATQYGKRGIRCNTIVPGWTIDTGWTNADGAASMRRDP